MTILVITMIPIFAASKIGKNIFKPFKKIRDAAKNVINGDFSVRLPENSRIMEIDEVATDFNIMVKELGNTEMLREEFITNVSHEFKTPLSVIEGYVTLLQGEISPKDINFEKIPFTILVGTKNYIDTDNLDKVVFMEEMEEYPEKNIYVLDSFSSGSGLALIVLRANELISRGLEFEEVITKLKRYVECRYTIFILSAFDNLNK